MNALVNFKNNPLTMSSREISDLTGKEHFHVRRDIEVMFEALELDASKFGCIYKDTMNRPQTEYLLDQDLTMTLVMGYSTALRYKVAVRWRELESGLASKAIHPSEPEKLQCDLMFLETATKVLRVSESGKLGMLRKVQTQHHIIDMLPSYAIDAPSDAVDGSSRVTYSLTRLLKDHGIEISTTGFNKILQANGFIEQLERASTKKPERVKRFWSITNKGLLYGKNVTSDNSPRETSPHWFASRFNDLLSKLNLSVNQRGAA